MRLVAPVHAQPLRRPQGGGKGADDTLRADDTPLLSARPCHAPPPTRVPITGAAAPPTQPRPPHTVPARQSPALPPARDGGRSAGAVAPSSACTAVRRNVRIAASRDRKPCRAPCTTRAARARIRSTICVFRAATGGSLAALRGFVALDPARAFARSEARVSPHAPVHCGRSAFSRGWGRWPPLTLGGELQPLAEAGVHARQGLA